MRSFVFERHWRALPIRRVLFTARARWTNNVIESWDSQCAWRHWWRHACVSWWVTSRAPARPLLLLLPSCSVQWPIVMCGLVTFTAAQPADVAAYQSQCPRYTARYSKLSGAVYCNRSCLWVCLRVWVCVCGWVCLWVCYHDNSKLRASIFTKLGL